MNTIKINVSFLAGPALDWAVAKCLGHHEWENYGSYIRIHLPDPKQAGYTLAFCPSTDWAQGGLIIEREKIGVQRCTRAGEYHGWVALRDESFNEHSGPDETWGPTPLIAAMRCYVASKLGEIVEVPRELYKED